MLSRAEGSLSLSLINTARGHQPGSHETQKNLNPKETKTPTMVIVLLRGFKVPVPVFDRFLEANGLMPTEGNSPFYDAGLREGAHSGVRDDATLLLRSKMGNGDTKTRWFVPIRRNYGDPASVYVAYDWIFVFAQRKINLAEELPDKAPPGFQSCGGKLWHLRPEGIRRRF